MTCPASFVLVPNFPMPTVLHGSPRATLLIYCSSFPPSSLPFVMVCVPQTLQQAQCLISLPKSSGILFQLLFTHSCPFISTSHLAIVPSLISLSFLLKSSLFLHTTSMPSGAVWTAEKKLSPRLQFLSLWYWKTTANPLKQDHIFMSQIQMTSCVRHSFS